MSVTDPSALDEIEPASAAVAEPAPDVTSVLTVDLGAIEANWRILDRRVMPVECAAVVKSDAYGCGLEPVTRTLAAAGCRTFFVGDLAEAGEVRKLAPESVIYVLNGLLPGTASLYADLYARPVIGSMVELAEWDSFCAGSDWHGGAAIHVDTGMNRLGLNPEEAAALSPRIQLERHGITLLMSHLACADTPDHPLNNRQLRLFRDVRSYFRGIPASLANSSGIFLDDSTHCDLIRPGVALYGANPTPYRANPMRPVVGLRARIVQIRSVLRGETIGYGAAWTAARVSRIGIVAAGYADGYARLNGAVDGEDGTEAVVAGARCRVVGRVSMDLLAVDLSNLPDHVAHRGDFVTLLGDGIGVDEIARASGLIPYEVLTGLGRRNARHYIQAQVDPDAAAKAARSRRRTR